MPFTSEFIEYLIDLIQSYLKELGSHLDSFCLLNDHQICPPQYNLTFDFLFFFAFALAIFFPSVIFAI